MHSMRSGNWEYVTIDDLAAAAVEKGDLTPGQATCAVTAWKAAGEPSYFATGAGVAGARGAQQSGHISDTAF